MTIIYTVLISVLALWLLWVFYVAVMHIAKVRDAGNLSRAAYVLGVPTLIVGFLLDLIVNVFVMTVILLEIPHETTVTKRLKRHHKESTGWRLKVVEFFETILDAFDPDGDHV